MIFNKSKGLHGANDRILAEANDWLMRIKAGRMTAKSEIQFQKWLAVDPRHQIQFDMMGVVWEGSEVYLKDTLALGDLNDALNRKPAAGRKKWFPDLGMGFSLQRLGLIAATVFLVVIGTLLTRHYLTLPTRYHTDTGIQKMVRLSDGSRIYLDTQTDVSVRFSKKARRIELRKGRAMFYVTHDPARPFTVSVDNIMARAVGTEFDIYKMAGGKISIAVMDGIIRVERNKSVKSTAADKVSNVPNGGKIVGRKPDAVIENAQLPFSGTLLASGKEIVVDRESTTYEIQPIDSRRVNSWQEGRLYFYMTPLPEVITEVNRYLDSKIVIGDPDLKTQPISVNFDLKHWDLFLPTLVSAMSIEAQKTASGDYILFKQ